MAVVLLVLSAVVLCCETASHFGRMMHTYRQDLWWRENAVARARGRFVNYDEGQRGAAEFAHKMASLSAVILKGFAAAVVIRTLFT